MERLEEVCKAIDKVAKGSNEVTVFVNGELVDVTYTLRPQAYPNEPWYEQQFSHTISVDGRVIGGGHISRADLIERLYKSERHVDEFYQRLVRKSN